MLQQTKVDLGDIYALESGPILVWDFRRIGKTLSILTVLLSSVPDISLRFSTRQRLQTWDFVGLLQGSIDGGEGNASMS